MDLALALIALLYPKLNFNEVLTLSTALLVLRGLQSRGIRIRNPSDKEDSLAGVIFAILLIIAAHFGGIPVSSAIPSIFIASFRKKLHYLLNLIIYFFMAFLFLFYLGTEWNLQMILLIAVVVALSSTLIIHANGGASNSVLLMLLNMSILIAFDIYRIDFSLYDLLLGFAVAFILSFLAMKSGVADETGLMAATIVGMLIIISTDLRFFVTLLLFYGIGSAATKYKYLEKEKLEIAEPAGGARGYSNVFANSLTALFFALNYGYFHIDAFKVGFVASLATALGDTLASEIGKTSKRVYLITNFKPVRPGESGGVSLIGEISAFVGSFIVSFYAFVFGMINEWGFVIALLSGFIGVHIDSILGATLEKRGYLNNSGVNFTATFSSAVLATIMSLW